MSALKPSTPPKAPFHLPTPKASEKAKTLGALMLPSAKGPAKRGGCCGR